MSVLLQEESIILLDSQAQLASEVPENGLNSTLMQYAIHQQFFCKPSMEAITLKSKRKRHHDVDDMDILIVVTEALNKLLKLDVARKFFTSGSVEGLKENPSLPANHDAHEIAIKLAKLDSNSLADRCYNMAVKLEKCVPFGFQSCIKNIKDQWQFIIVNSQRYLMPPQSSFIMSDLRVAHSLLSTKYTECYDFIVIDPPWVNKSVKRQKRYHCIENEDLLNLPIRKLVSSQGLVIIWCTNSNKNQEYVEDTLLPAWNLRLISKWYWLKVTRSGKPVLPFDYVHRRPFEMLYVTAAPEFYVDIPESVIVSVPSSVHSRKPPLYDTFRTRFQPMVKNRRPKCLELFARELHEGWVSWGNEPIRFQHSSCFDLDQVGAIPTLNAEKEIAGEDEPQS